MKKIAILGITGSIGSSAVRVVNAHPELFQIVLASSQNNYRQLLNLARSLKIPNIVLTNAALKNSITDVPSGTRLFFGEETLLRLLVETPCDLVLNAISGSAGLDFTVTALENDLDLALANKESLVLAGHIIRKILTRSHSRLIPVDSEHSAIFQALGNIPIAQVRALILTASGGPFRDFDQQHLAKVTVQQALTHPTWNMGAKITIDSATMMNKGLEVIEAHWLFNMKYTDIKTVIHPQSVVHSLVEFRDGSLIAQMSIPDMSLPVLFAFNYPDHGESNICKTDITALPALTFQPVDERKYPLLFLARAAGEQGGLYPTILNAANEAAVHLFLDHKIEFLQIALLVRRILENEQNQADPDLDTIRLVNQQTFQKTLKEYKEHLI